MQELPCWCYWTEALIPWIMLSRKLAIGWQAMSCDGAWWAMISVKQLSMPLLYDLCAPTCHAPWGARSMLASCLKARLWCCLFCSLMWCGSSLPNFDNERQMKIFTRPPNQRSDPQDRLINDPTQGTRSQVINNDDDNASRWPGGQNPANSWTPPKAENRRENTLGWKIWSWRGMPADNAGRKFWAWPFFFLRGALKPWRNKADQFAGKIRWKNSLRIGVGNSLKIRQTKLENLGIKNSTDIAENRNGCDGVLWQKEHLPGRRQTDWAPKRHAS